MCSGILIVFCGTLVLVNTLPVVYDYYNPNTGDAEEIEFRDNDYQSPDFERSPCLQTQNGDVKCFFTNGAQGKLPETLEYSPLPQDRIEIAGRQLEFDPSSVFEQNIGVLQNPEITELLPFNPTFNDYQYESSPIQTYIHGLVPQDTSAFYDNIYPSEGPLPFNRLARRTTSYDEFLAQLSHDAMMNNILPTMPFLRTTGNQYLVPYSSEPAYVRASFPQASRGCAKPFLFGCSPIIYQGIMAHKRYPYAPVVQVSAPYKESLRSHKVTDEKLKSVVDSKKKEVLKVSVPEYDTCPPGESMGYYLQCVRPTKISRFNQAQWELYPDLLEHRNKESNLKTKS